MKKCILLYAACFFVAWPAHGREGGETRPALIPPGGLSLFFSSAGPLSYRSLTRIEIPKDAELIGSLSGESCQYSLSVPISLTLRGTSLSGAVGNGTFNKIIEEMEKAHPGLRGIYDVKVDLHSTTILGIFGKLCTEIKALGYQ